MSEDLVERLQDWNHGIPKTMIVSEAIDEIESLRSRLVTARRALECAETWLSGWASAEPYISDIRAALKEVSK